VCAIYARAWLRSRDPAPPPSLADRMISALDAAPAARKPWEQLLAAGVASLARALSAGDRSTALDLLAADALLTSAAEAAAEAGPADLESCLGRSGPGSLGARFAPE
jgi:hypothetical protein